MIYGDIRIEPLTQRITKAGQTINLSPREFSLLTLLIRNKDVIFSRKQILDEIWESSEFVDPNIVDQYVSYIRRKIDTKSDSIIETIRGVGYRIPKLKA